jgi:diadenosine tetraphosphatase ApaH/serine/threonine PP2A family protein phosphatase
MQACGAVVLRGNHEELALRGAHGESMGALTAVWTHGQLGAARLEWLAGLPLTHVDGPLMLVHASADQPDRWHYVDDARSAARSLDAALNFHPELRYVMGGHVHHQTLYYRGQGQQLLAFKPTPGVSVPVPVHRRWVATIGSVGQPRDGDTRAAYATLDVARQQLCFHRVSYDHLATARAVRSVGLPEALAVRLEKGQ